ncbi:Histone acetyltransferase [Handroanthus impetiginosus]|uniref:Histone acetyltransferase n=1 Tax=Handroanthus impetiginosus TaxID=429701 RepID=A0A2G9HQM6_9LAMI|nr:Histone acetyltransferase [Handroanthus impetiginosus]
MRMEGSGRSGVIKKKSSSGCLIIKKKVGNNNSGGGLGGLTDSSKAKKRARIDESGSSSSDEDESLEFMRRKVMDKRLNNGSMGYKRDNAGIDIGVERKRSRLDLFEFDEYDEFDGRSKYFEGRFESIRRSGSGNLKESGVGSSNRNVVVDKCKHGSSLDGSSSGRSKGLELEEDEAHMPISLLRLKYQETANEPIRLQGKNGVLKVMVNKKKKMDFPSQPKNYDHRDLKERKGSRPNDVVKKELSAALPNYQTSNPSENQDVSVGKLKKETKPEKGKQLSNKSSKSRVSEIDGTDNVLKLAPPSLRSSKRTMKKEEERSPSPENFTPLKGKEGKEAKAKRGGSTEKQMLREKIRGMLVDAGWTIDYRPRRNRDYLDAVYINPTGTAYWSIVKAYDAFKKQLGEDNGETKANVGSSSVAPLSEDLINKLTRQTKKKIEEEKKRKRNEGSMIKSAKRSVRREAAESSDSDENEERINSYMKQNCKSKRGKLCKADQDSDDDSNEDGSPKRKSVKVRVEKPSVQGRTSKVIGRCTLLVRGSDRGDNSDNDGYVPYSGKRTVLAWLIDSGVAKLSEKVQYMNRRRSRVMLEGWITRDGIHCGCCSKILTVSKFELHAGSKLRQPFQNIVLESGSSLLDCQIDAWNRQDESLRRDFHTVDVDGDDPDDDTCGICGDGGDLICCDSCPSTFHQICLGIKMLPSGDWHCPNCTCKFCGRVSVNVAEENDRADDELNKCGFCEKKYHKSCSERSHAPPLSSNGASFCGQKCQQLHDHLQKFLGVRHELEAGFSWSLIQRTDVSDPSQRGFAQRVECNSKLAVALSVMEECFLPIIDRKSGINMLHNVVYNCGSNFNRLNFRGFYTVILERSDEIICAASIRLHGARLAEMPFIGTREIYRQQGMCRRLLSAIEAELCALKVGQLIIPAISEHTNMWTAVFGFHELEDIHKKEIKPLNMLVFPGTDMLQKQLVKQENSDAVRGKGFESTSNQPELPVLVKKSDPDSSLEQNRQSASNYGGPHEAKTNSKVDALDSNSPAPVASDDPLTSQGNTAVKPELEDEQKEASATSSDTQNQLLDPSANDNTNSPVESELHSYKEPSGDSAAATEAKLDVHSSIEPSGDSAAATEAKGDVHSSKESAAATEAEVDVHSSIEPSEDSAAATEAKVDASGDIVDSSKSHEISDKARCHETASCFKENVEVSDPELTSGPVGTINKNENPVHTENDCAVTDVVQETVDSA